MNTRVKNIGIFRADTVFCLNLETVTNEGDRPIPFLTVKVDIPEGVEYESDNLSAGMFNTNRSMWEAGTLYPGRTITGSMCFKVTDPTKAPFKFTFTVSNPDGCINCDAQMYSIETTGLSCVDMHDCFGTNVPGTPAELNALADVAITNPATDEILIYSGGMWKNLPQPAVATGGEIVKEGTGYKLKDNPTTTVGDRSVILFPVGDAPKNDAIYLPITTIAGVTLTLDGVVDASQIHGIRHAVASNASVEQSYVNGYEFQANNNAGVMRCLSNGYQISVNGGSHSESSILVGKEIRIGSRGATSTSDADVEYSALIGNALDVTAKMDIKQSLILGYSMNIGDASATTRTAVENSVVIGDGHYPAANTKNTFWGGLNNQSDPEAAINNSIVTGNRVQFRGASTVESSLIVTRHNTTTLWNPVNLMTTVIAGSSNFRPVANASLTDSAVIGCSYVAPDSVVNGVFLGIKGTSGAPWSPQGAVDEAVYVSNLNVVREDAVNDVADTQMLLRSTVPADDGRVKMISAADFFSSVDLSTLPTATDDAAAATAGVPVGHLYIDPATSILKVRQV